MPSHLRVKELGHVLGGLVLAHVYEALEGVLHRVGEVFARGPRLSAPIHTTPPTARLSPRGPHAKLDTRTKHAHPPLPRHAKRAWLHPHLCNDILEKGRIIRRTSCARHLQEEAALSYTEQGISVDPYTERCCIQSGMAGDQRRLPTQHPSLPIAPFH